MAGRSQLHRWVCPLCNSGVLASSRPRRDDVARYCLDCSRETGRLVERTCPALEKRRQERRDQQARKAQRKRKLRRSRQEASKRERAREQEAREASQAEEYGDLQGELGRLWGVLRQQNPDLRTDLPAMKVWRRQQPYATGHAWCGHQHRIHLTLGPVDRAQAWGVLAHELAHLATPADEQTHGPAFWGVLVRLCNQAYGTSLQLSRLRREERTAYQRQLAVEQAIRQRLI